MRSVGDGRAEALSEVRAALAERPDAGRHHRVEGVGTRGVGALYTEDFRRALDRTGCPDARTVAAYHGAIIEHPHAFDLDDHHRFHTGEPALVYGNTAGMLGAPRYAAHFTVTGDKDRHVGLCPCDPTEAATAAGPADPPGCC
ncbi:hypothetical protein [Streptomyces durbertensis]|uniref:hypothetical protein n=1 Tax=Streptomyces durbertensis TaxID=2448886 RepID=UPI001E3E033A|nr:hypothetical protein [Streptomyces durbertensis]